LCNEKILTPRKKPRENRVRGDRRGGRRKRKVKFMGKRQNKSDSDRAL